MASMEKILRIIALIVGIISTGVLTIIPLACASGQNMISLPPSALPEKGNPKLDSQLNQLIRAEVQGEVAQFVEQRGIELTDGKVRVIIECLPGQLEQASEAALNAGAELETSYDDMLQVLVSISSLNTLADASSIRFIRLPQQPLPGKTE